MQSVTLMMTRLGRDCYLDDPYAPLLTRVRGPARKSPLINVGTHHRTLALDHLVTSFLETTAGAGQVVSLGAGSDTRFWRLSDGPHRSHKYVEVDFPHNTSIKAQRIARSPRLTEPLTGSVTPPSSASSPAEASAKPYTVSKGGAQLTSERYALLPIDLRPGRAAGSPTLDERLDAELLPQLDPTRPVLFLAECLFCYMDPAESTAIIHWFAARFPSCVGVVYEMFGLNVADFSDAFGRVMHRNLAARHLTLPGVTASMGDHIARFQASSPGFEQVGVINLWDTRPDWAANMLTTSVARIEMLDEIEELRLVLSHYCIAWAAQGDGWERFPHR